MPTLLLSILVIALLLYGLFCLVLYLKQESLIFFPQKLSPNHPFHFEHAFEEVYVETPEGTSLHGLLFKVPQQQEKPQRLIFFLHGNAGSVDSWGTLAPLYTRLGYDVFMLDYRGYGKSGGRITSEEQFYADAEAAYIHMARLYAEAQIVVTGISLGTGAAAMLAARHQPRMLLLLTPYYSLTDMVRRLFPLVPPFLLKYKFSTHKFLDQTKAPVYIFHGTADEVIPYASAQKLQPHLKPGDRFFTLEGVGHNTLHDNREFLQTLHSLLAPEN